LISFKKDEIKKDRKIIENFLITYKKDFRGFDAYNAGIPNSAGHNSLETRQIELYGDNRTFFEFIN